MKAPAEGAVAQERLARWARRLPWNHVVVLGCCDGPTDSHDDSEGQPVRWPIQWQHCLTDFPVADLVTLAAAAPRIELRPGRCTPDRSSDQTSPCAPAWAVAMDLLERAGGRERLSVVPAGAGSRSPGPVSQRAPTLQDLPVSRRALFSWLRPVADEAATSGPPGSSAGPPADGTGSGTPERLPTSAGRGHGQAEDQVRIAAALQEVLRQHGGEVLADPRMSESHQELPGSAPRARAQLLTSAGCTACGTCVRACPTAALDLTAHEEDGDTFNLVLNPAACISCQHCVAICPAQALDPGPPLDWDDLANRTSSELLEQVQVRQCRRCRTDFAGEGELCQVCAMRQQNPFGSWMPPGLVAPRVYAPRHRGPGSGPDSTSDRPPEPGR